MFTVIYAPQFADWLSTLDDEALEDVEAMIELLKTYGYNLARPYADTIKGSKFNNLKELRIQHDGRPLRAFFIFDPLRQAIVLCGGDKTGDKRFYQKMIPLAESIYQYYLTQLEQPQ
ncbi:type II toxin-antitoxin system RelE/ParE family toxin [Neisseria leonii]|uniref:type II toxin-antitoxin system RelE/ParE family toxin n=1 Tax=Neisseria leonii TaxID=2995413 RepID=UPI00237B8534|nr:type II toxin-antitoxin system RelE/ParE family toxin [Neisseria sp. 3986]MDD9325181.1 type II toxin-antitoxin system RelE/ParE family toxin [Neisseria sp. 3986]